MDPTLRARPHGPDPQRHDPTRVRDFYKGVSDAVSAADEESLAYSPSAALGRAFQFLSNVDQHLAQKSPGSVHFVACWSVSHPHAVRVQSRCSVPLELLGNYPGSGIVSHFEMCLLWSVLTSYIKIEHVSCLKVVDFVDLNSGNTLYDIAERRVRYALIQTRMHFNFPHGIAACQPQRQGN